MKSVLISFFVFLCINLQALYVGNFAEPQLIDKGFFLPQDTLFDVKIGYQQDWVYDRRLQAYDQIDNKIDRFTYWMQQGVVAINFLDRLEAYGSIGYFTADFWLRPSADNERQQYETDQKVTFGGGAKLILMQWGETAFGIDGKMQYSAPRIKWVTINGVSEHTQAHLVYREWQVGVGLAHTVDFLTPYLGGTYSQVHTHIGKLQKDIFSFISFREKNIEKFGLVVGCGISTGKKVDLNLEARMFNEEAFTVAGNIKF